MSIISSNLNYLFAPFNIWISQRYFFTKTFYLYYNACSISPKSMNVSHSQNKPQNVKKCSENPIFMTIQGKKMAIKLCPYVLWLLLSKGFWSPKANKDICFYPKIIGDLKQAKLKYGRISALYHVIGHI